MLRLICCHSVAVLGSNTIHCVPCSIDLRKKISVRRTLTYFRSAFKSPPTVRAPQTTMLPLRLRMQLTPPGLSPDWSALLSAWLTPSAP